MSEGNHKFDSKQIIDYFAIINDEIRLKVNKKFPRLMFIFSWDEVPENNSVNLINFLDTNLGAGWVKKARIEKINDGREITISDGKKSYLFSLNGEKTIAILKTDDEKTHEFIVKKENGNLNVYLRSQPSPFDVEIIVRSLLSMGIPLANVFDIVDKVVNSIKLKYPPNSTIDSGEITKFVENAILGQEHSSKLIWGLIFTKMFEERGYVKLEDEAGQTFDDLTTEKIRNIIVSTIAKSLDKSEEEIKELFKNELSGWAGVALDIVKRMGTSSINIKTLEYFISDLAFKSPKPWIGSVKFNDEQINEHIAGIEKQLELIDIFYKNQKKINDARMYVVKALDDVSELILNKYGILYTSTPTKPFNKLYLLIKDIINDTDVGDFYDFKNDIYRLNYKIDKINEICKYLKEDNIKTIPAESFQKIIDRLRLLFSIGKRIYVETNLRQLWDDCLKSENEKEKFDKLKLLFEEILNESKDFAIKEIFEKAILLEVEKGVPIFNAFGTRIYCRIHPFDKPLDTINIFDFLGEFVSDIEKSKIDCRIGLSISLKGANKSDYEIFKKTTRIDKFLLFLDAKDIEQLLLNPETFMKLVGDKFSKYLNEIKPVWLPPISNNVPVFERKDLIKAWNNINAGLFAEASSLCIDLIESFLLDYLIFILKTIHGENWLEESKNYSQKKQTIKHWTFGEIIGVLTTTHINSTFKEKASKLYTGQELKTKIMNEREKEFATSINGIRTHYYAHKEPGPIDQTKIHRLWLDVQELINSISAKGFFPFIVYVHKKENSRIFAVNQYGKKVIVDSTKSSQVASDNLYYLIPKEKAEETKDYIYIINGQFIRYGIICSNCKENELFLTDSGCVKCGEKIKVHERLNEYITESKPTILEFINKFEDIKKTAAEIKPVTVHDIPKIISDIQLTASEKGLIENMFEGLQSLYVIDEFTSGFSETRVMKVRPKDKRGDFQITQIIKIGPTSLIKEEIDHYNFYVNNYLNKGEHAEVSSHKEHSDLAGICYNYVGGDSHNLISFGDFYKKYTIAESINLLNQLYKSVLHSWYRNRKLEQLNLYNEYVSPLLTNKKIFSFIEGQFKNENDKIYIKELNRYFINPMIFLNSLDKNYWQETYISTVHGDLNLNNIQVEDDTRKIWLVDFYKTNKSHLMKDFTKLEAVIKFELLEITDLKSFLNLENILVNNFALKNDLLKNITLNAELKNAFVCFETIRNNIIELNYPKDNLNEYLMSLLFYTLSPLAWDNFSLENKKRAFYSSVLIADKLKSLSGAD